MIAKPKKKQRVFGIDPGLETIGYGCIESNGIKHQLISGGIIKTSSKDDIGQRLIVIYDTITALIKEFKPEVISMEKLFFFRNVTSAMKVSQAQGVLLLSLSQQNIPIFEYTPLHIKGVMTGYGRADKKEVKAKVREFLLLTEDIKDDNHADALAVALTHVLQIKERPADSNARAED